MLLLQAVSTGSTVGVGFWSVDVGGYGVLVVHWLDEWSMDPLTVGISPRWEKIPFAYLFAVWKRYPHVKWVPDYRCS
jgi:hypothetical protein